ncbi:hypothetical protein F2P56_025344 [Juglans regia]|uniref:Uncharacterized protein LOC109000162 n=2 Tax=Juglans regia TaxID=51240 RepID=A0A2I4FLN7_JUGRE|nr:uncharacterized protein LOC109000162 [Juglans regia]KAF5455807.1 hypothetical protein F2P56_025344 [Juglans regia]
MEAQPPIMRPIQPDQTFRDDWVSYFQYKPERDSASDVRSALLVVMALIAAATFQAGLNPPGGVWQDNKNDHGVNQEAGTAILGSYSHNCKVFFFFNTLAFSSSIYVIGCVNNAYSL